MTDDPILEKGLGSIDSPPDERDWPIDALYAAAGLDRDASPPASFLVDEPYPPILDQGSSPMCVAYTASTLKAYQDLRDTGPADFDEPRFFTDIGGTAQGAVPRIALQRLLDVGYPTVGATPAPDRHRIAAYYAVPVDELELKNAIMAFGPVWISTRWFRSWFRPVSGILPAPDTAVGGHSLAAVGWDARGLRLRNSWGSDYGILGDVFMPWSYLTHVREAWKSVDRILTPPPTLSYRISIAAGTRTVYAAALASSGCIRAWTALPWSGKASSAPCRAPVVRRGCTRGQATLAPVMSGAFKGRWIRVAAGVSVVRS